MVGARFMPTILTGRSEAYLIQSERGLSERLLLKLSISVRSMTARGVSGTRSVSDDPEGEKEQERRDGDQQVERNGHGAQYARRVAHGVSLAGA